MKIELIHVADITEIDRPCEICEQQRTDIGAILIVKQIDREDPQVDLLICDVCAAKISIATTRRYLQLEQRAPPPPKIDGGGGS